MDFRRFCSEEYGSYPGFPEFWEGVSDYGERSTRGYADVRAQAYDRGQEAAMRFVRGDVTLVMVALAHKVGPVSSSDEVEAALQAIEEALRS